MADSTGVTCPLLLELFLLAPYARVGRRFGWMGGTAKDNQRCDAYDHGRANTHRNSIFLLFTKGTRPLLCCPRAKSQGWGVFPFWIYLMIKIRRSKCSWVTGFSRNLVAPFAVSCFRHGRSGAERFHRLYTQAVQAAATKLSVGS